MPSRKQAGEQGTRRTRQKARKVGYVVVGLGHFAQDAILPAFKNAKKNSQLVALVSGDPKKHRVLGKRHGVPVYGYEQFEECLALPEVDAVYIALPNSLHAEYAVRAARAGAHVLCEKPLALDEPQCLDMIRAAEDSDVKLMTAYRLHFESTNLAAMEAVRKGRIGEPRLFSSSFSFQIDAPNIRVEADKGGGVLWDIGVYCVNAARYLFRAEPEEVFAFKARGKDARFAETEEAVSAVLRFPDDRLASFNVSFGTAATGTYQLVGTKGSLRLENAYDYKGKMTLELETKGKKKRTLPARDQIGPEISYFSDCILHGREVEPSGWEGLADVRIIRALYESAETGRPVRLEPFEKRQRPTGEQEQRLPPTHPPEPVNASPPMDG
ncbi:putative dehydrogenase [Archangium gephyra]|uniref:Dehydrogenase n=1 Tax=Archangium gephyra TaxID=48 RepID=A0AAC8TC74_9BACT|nr:Gfo/Idh/MocA family oxidoreductase [Archangium gephyra]AKI99130.1 putative glucose-fructose oxidoreductase oxidoreductase protein [Archangium gephyra]REG31038.1 putative dehydrogenase [Archangium gephyra]